MSNDLEFNRDEIREAANRLAKSDGVLQPDIHELDDYVDEVTRFIIILNILAELFEERSNEAVS